jgi:hypothetical protein
VVPADLLDSVLHSNTLNLLLVRVSNDLRFKPTIDRVLIGDRDLMETSKALNEDRLE